MTFGVASDIATPADFNGDGRMDVAAANFSDASITMLFSSGCL